jgi:hypothetical protein
MSLGPLSLVADVSESDESNAEISEVEAEKETEAKIEMKRANVRSSEANFNHITVNM